MDENEKLLKRTVATLKRDNTQLKAKVKVLDRKFDMLQDEEAKLGVEMQSLIQSVSFIVNVALEISKREGIKADMGLNNPDESKPAPTPPGTVPPGMG